MEIRPIRSHEYPDAVAMAVRSMGSPPAGEEPSADQRADYTGTLEGFEERSAQTIVLVAIEGENLVGMATYVPHRDTPYSEFSDEDAAGIRMVEVDPAVRGRGVGGALVDACIERARAGGRRRVVLHTAANMATAQRLYERRGFVRAPERDFEPRPGLLLIGYVLEFGGGPTNG